MNWYPDLTCHRVSDITLEQLHQWGVRGLILDIDNTLTTHDNPVPSQGVSQWLDQMRQGGIQLMVLSNNKPERVAPFAGLLGLDFIANGAKPLKGGYRRCAKAMGLSRQELGTVGDQLFTDIWGGNRFGCRTILVEPIQLETMPFFRVKRWLERRCLAHRRRKGGERL